MPLSDRENEQNQTFVDGRFALYFNNKRQDSKKIDTDTFPRWQQFRSAMLAFAEKNNINLMDVSVEDKKDSDHLAMLCLIANEAVDDSTGRFASGESKIATWVTEHLQNDWLPQLKNARPEAITGGSASVFAAQSTSMIDAHERMNASIGAGYWDTDLDIQYCLGKDLTDPKNISNAGSYILPPVSLDVTSAAIQDKLQDAINAIKENKIAGDVKILIPVNCGKSHWELAEAVIQNQVMTSCRLIDSFANSSHGKKSSVFKNFQAAVNAVMKTNPVSVQLEALGQQNNSWSCGDFTLQNAYRRAGINNSITSAGNNALALRNAVIAQVFTNQKKTVPASSVKPQNTDKRVNTTLSKTTTSSTTGCFKDFSVDYSEHDDKQQARIILDEVRRLHDNGKGYNKVGITYSANHKQTDRLRKWNADKNPSRLWNVSGTGQAAVIAEINQLLQGDYKELQSVFRVLPITTMNEGCSGTFYQTRIGDDLADINNFLRAGGAVLGWQNQNSNDSSKEPNALFRPYAVSSSKGSVAGEKIIRKDPSVISQENLKKVQTALTGFSQTYRQQKTLSNAREEKSNASHTNKSETKSQTMLSEQNRDDASTIKASETNLAPFAEKDKQKIKVIIDELNAEHKNNKDGVKLVSTQKTTHCEVKVEIPLSKLESKNSEQSENQYDIFPDRVQTKSKEPVVFEEALRAFRKKNGDEVLPSISAPGNLLAKWYQAAVVVYGEDKAKEAEFKDKKTGDKYEPKSPSLRR